MILIAPDKFKGTYTAGEMCALIAERLRLAGVDVPVVLRPMADGGEGIADVLMRGARHVAEGIYELDGRRLAVSSEIVGFKAFEGSGIPLMGRSSYALGAAIDPDIPTDIAIGGTAVSDAGAGFLQALGARFFDRLGREITAPLCPSTLPDVASADFSALRRQNLSGIIDVKASLVGGPLTALDFAPQKALSGESLEGLAEALAHFQEVCGGSSPYDGAGGGLGYALASVCGAPCRSGAQAAVDSLDVDWRRITLVITGEGRVDRQTLVGGKLVDAIWRKASSMGIPTLIIYGCAEDTALYPRMMSLTDFLARANP